MCTLERVKKYHFTINTAILLKEQYFITVKPETLMSQNFDEFGNSGSYRQTLTLQSKATKQDKRLQII